MFQLSGFYCKGLYNYKPGMLEVSDVMATDLGYGTMLLVVVKAPTVAVLERDLATI